MEQDSSPVVPVSLEFNGVRVTLSLPEPKRARTTTTPTKDLTEAPPIPVVPAFHPGTKTKSNAHLEPFKVVLHGDEIACGNGPNIAMSSTVEKACDAMKNTIEWQRATTGQVGHTLLVLKQVDAMLFKSRNGDENIDHELATVIALLQTYYDDHPAHQMRIDSLDGITADTFDKFIELLINVFILLDRKYPTSVANSDAKAVMHALTDFGYVYRGLVAKKLTLRDMFIE